MLDGEVRMRGRRERVENATRRTAPGSARAGTKEANSAATRRQSRPAVRLTGSPSSERGGRKSRGTLLGRMVAAAEP